MPFAKKTIPEQFADRLLSDIVQGRFGALLPSVRELVERYKLNPVSIHKGVSILVGKGVLVSRGPRRRLSIVPRPASKDSCDCKLPGVPCCRPLIFVGADPSEMNSTLLMATNDIQQATRAKGGGCMTVALGGLSSEAKAEAVRAALLEHKPSHVLLLYCDQEVYEWVSRRQVKVALMGGTIVSRKAEKLVADMSLLACAAFADLQSLGHRRFRLVMLGRPAVPAEKLRLEEFSLGQGVDARGVFDGELDLPSMSRVLAASLQAGVTAFAFPRPEDFVLAKAYFDTQGIKVPGDVSIVMLLSGPYDFMQEKQPAHFKITKEAIVSLVLGWFEFGENRSERCTREVIPSYVRGRTVGPAKASKQALA